MIAWAIEALVASTALMLLVLALRSPVRRAFGAGVAYALWLLPAVRLLLPPLPSVWREAATAPIRQASETVTVLVVEPLAGAPAPVDALAQTETASWLSASMLTTGAFLLWAAGAIAFLVWQMLRHRQFCSTILRKARRVVSGHINVVETEAATGPLAFGIWRRYVAFPADFNDRYDDDERALALAHELTHHARGDLIANWAALVVLAIHWFNPIAWRSFRAFRADQEMACDARVLAGRDPAFRHAYGRAIVKSAHGRAVSAACHLHTINELKGRLRMLSQGNKSRARVMGGAVSVAVLTVAGLGLTASGTQAAERLRTRVTKTIGVDIAKLDMAKLDITKLDVAAAIAPSAAATSGPGADALPTPPTPPAPATVPLPPSSVAQAQPPAPPAPPVAGVAPVPPAPPAPPVADVDVVTLAGDDNVDRREWTDADGKRHVIMIRKRSRGGDSADWAEGKPGPDGKPVIHKHVVIRNLDKLQMKNMPEVSSMNCPADGNPRETVIKGRKNGRQTIVICTNRIERLTADASRDAERAARIAINTKDIERNAYQSALNGLRSARARMEVKGNAEAIKGIDEAIAELEDDLAKLN